MHVKSVEKNQGLFRIYVLRGPQTLCTQFCKLDFALSLKNLIHFFPAARDKNLSRHPSIQCIAAKENR
jgi:hypothetical protein